MISNLAYIHPDAKLGENVTVEPFAYIEADVVIGDGSWIGPHASVMAGTRMGKNCKVHSGAVIGGVKYYVGHSFTLLAGKAKLWLRVYDISFGE